MPKIVPYLPMGHLGYKAAQSSNFFVNIAPQNDYTNQVPWKNIAKGQSFCFLRKKTSGLVLTGLPRLHLPLHSYLPNTFWLLETRLLQRRRSINCRWLLRLQFGCVFRKFQKRTDQGSLYLAITSRNYSESSVIWWFI